MKCNVCGTVDEHGPHTAQNCRDVVFHALNVANARAKSYEEVLERIAQWDCLNVPHDPTGTASYLCSDFPWLKKLVNDALEAGKKKP